MDWGPPAEGRATIHWKSIRPLCERSGLHSQRTASHEFVDDVPKFNREEINFSTVGYTCTGVFFEVSFKAYLTVMRGRAKSIKGCHQEARKLPMSLPLY